MVDHLVGICWVEGFERQILCLVHKARQVLPIPTFVLVLSRVRAVVVEVNSTADLNWWCLVIQRMELLLLFWNGCLMLIILSRTARNIGVGSTGCVTCFLRCGGAASEEWRKSLKVGRRRIGWLIPFSLSHALLPIRSLPQNWRLKIIHVLFQFIESLELNYKTLIA